MKYIITGSLGNISKPLTQKLLAAGHDVTVITSKESNRSAIEALGAKAAVGTIEDVAFLTKTFTGADAVYTMVPPHFSAQDWKGYIGKMGQNYAEAIKASGVKHVVNLSSIGAHMPEGCGPVSGIYRVEQALNKLEGVDILHLRPGNFYTNLYANIGMIKGASIIGGNYGNNTKIVLVHPTDIAAVAAEELTRLSFKGKSFRYIASDERSTTDLAKVLGAAIGKADLPWIDFKDEDSLSGIIGAGLPEEIAKNYVEMGQAIRNGKMFEDYHKHPVALSKTKLEDFAKEFAAVYKAS
ncbi:MAG TPA: NAD(P)H-binding protein [Cytophagaceae bacterium]|jgi:uncharacterized protein YbjT (DUF2867 family)|nr:NAD(P)H-binding protein [Cytophagaceae bacterium]